jgi:hypothetical protein
MYAYGIARCLCYALHIYIHTYIYNAHERRVYKVRVNLMMILIISNEKM